MTKDRKTKVDKILHRKLNSTIKCGMNLDALKWQVVPTYGIQNDEVIYEAENANPLKAFFLGDLSHRIVVDIILQYQIRKVWRYQSEAENRRSDNTIAKITCSIRDKNSIYTLLSEKGPDFWTKLGQSDARKHRS